MTPHTPGASGATCEVCHVPHSAATSEGIFRSRGTAPAQSSTCFFCHDGTGAVGNVKTGPDSFNGTSGHRIEDVIDSAAQRDLTNSCSGCHIPHEDPAIRPKLPARTVNGVNVAAAGTDWCLACHNDAQSWYALIGTYPQLSAPSRDTTGYPTAGTFGGSTLYKNATANAHVLIPEGAEPGRVAGDCLYCHTAHRGPSAYDGLDGQYRPSKPATVATDRSNGDYAAVCFQCHGGDASWIGRGAADIKQYVTHEAADTSLMASGGHRIKSSGGTLPVNSPLPCYDCHNPHGSSRGNKSLISDEVGANLDTASAAGVRKFCLSCHVTSDLLGWDSTSSTYVAPAAGAKVEGLLRNGGTNGSGPDGGYNWLRLKVTPGHQSSDANSCYECHGNTYGAANSNNVHDPGSYSVALHTGTPTASTITIKGVAYGPYACSTCHTVELGPEHDKSTSSSNATDCATCHPTPRSSLVPSWNRNTCAQGNCHAGTSVDPMHGTINADHTTTGPCSTVNCHSQSAAAIHSALSGQGCSVCHGPGITPTLACATCHASPHTNSATLNHGSADICSSCHSVGNITTIHGDDCAKCHPTPVTAATVYTSCTQANCHIAGSEHSGVPGYPTSDHNPPHGDYGYCWDCHPDEGGGCPSCHTWDRSAPTTTSNAQASYVSAAVITLTATEPDPWGMGIRGTYYQVDGGPKQTGTLIVVPGPTNGVELHSIEFWSDDNGFNTEAPHKVAHFTIAAGVDNTAPSGTMSVNGGAAYTNNPNVTVNSAVTDVGAGVSAMRIDPGTGVYGAWVPYAASYPITMPAGEGTKTVRAEYRDPSNNTVALSDTIVVDVTRPAGSVIVNGGAIYTNSLTVTMSTAGISDALSGVTQMRTNGLGWYGPWMPFAPTVDVTIGGGTGTRWVYGEFMDAAGNTYSTYDTITLDGVLPTGTMSVNNGAPSTNNLAVTVNSAVTDPNSGIDVMRVDPGTGTFGGWIPYQASYNITMPAGEGVKTVRAEYRDRAANVLALTDTIFYSLSLDPTPPTGTILINGGAAWTNSLGVTLTLSANDGGGSGVYDMRFSNDNTTWSAWELYATSKSWTMLTGAGTKTVYVQYRDAVGNISAGNITDQIGWEGTVPTGSIVVNGGAAWTDNQVVTLALTAADVGGSGLADMRFSNDYSTWSAWEPFNATKSWTLSAGVGLKAVYVQYRDGAGNLSAAYPDTIAYLLDQTLTYSAGTGGTISGNTYQVVHYGDSGTQVTAVPSLNFYFLRWSDGASVAARTDTNVTNDLNVQAWFARTGSYTVNFTTDGTGYVSGQWIQGVMSGGSTTAVTAVSDDSAYTFSYWSNGSTNLYSNPLVINNVTSNQTWTAYFSYSGSCPFLFTWDGTKYVFEADEFAAGYLGLRTSKGYRRPNPLDYHVLATTPAVKSGTLEYKLVEERDEVDYLDQAKLYSVETTSGRDIYVERSQAEGVGQFTTLDAVIHTVARDLQPPPGVTWVNKGQDVRDRVAATDGEFVILNDDRNVGFNYQTLELDLGDVKDAPMVKLVIDGRTMIPTTAAGRAYSRTFGPQAKLEVQDAAGNWVAVPSTKAILPKPPEFNRAFVLNLSNVWVSDSRKVRITYLYKTYIDSILLDTTADEPVTLTELPLVSANLQPHGFDYRTGIGEWYDYVYGEPFSEPRYKLPGNYTKFGNVSTLLREIDDKFVIFGGGDEITFRFQPPAAQPEGVTRRYLFLSDGYYKTLKEDIAHTVEPLPFAAMSNYPYAATESYPTDADHQAYLSEWNTRHEGN